MTFWPDGRRRRRRRHPQAWGERRLLMPRTGFVRRATNRGAPRAERRQNMDSDEMYSCEMILHGVTYTVWPNGVPNLWGDPEVNRTL